MILIFGTKPGKKVDAKSTLVVDFFEYLHNSADENGYVPLNGNLIYFKTQDMRNEITFRVTKPTLLKISYETQKTNLVGCMLSSLLFPYKQFEWKVRDPANAHLT